MDKFIIDEIPLEVSTSSDLALKEELFGLYRQLAMEKESTEQREKQWKQEKDDMQRQFRRRLADLGAEVFHVKRCVESLREPMQNADLSKEAKRLELMGRRFDQALQQAGVNVEWLEGRELDDELADVVEVIGHIEADISTPCIHETVAPLVTVDGQVMHFAKVVTSVPLTSKE